MTPAQRPGTVLVIGAGGYIGSHLVPALLAQGWTVRAGFTAIAKADRMPWRDQVSCIELDVTDPNRLRYAVRRVDAVVYLVHSMVGDDFADRDRLAADLTAAAVTAEGVPRVVYVSGLIPRVRPGRLSAHLASRLDVEQRLSASTATVVTLRAAIVLGAGSTSFEMMRQIASRLPVHAIPAWMLTSKVQPVAIGDLVQSVLGALRADVPTGAFDVGGPDRLTYRRLLRRYSRIAGLIRAQVILPFAPSDIVGRLAGLITDVPDATVRALVESLRHDMVCRPGARAALRPLLPAGHEMTGLDEAIRAALAHGGTADG